MPLRPLPLFPVLDLPSTFGPIRRAACHVHHIFNSNDSIVGAAVFSCTILSILLSVVVSCVQSFPAFRRGNDRASMWFTLETACVVAFTADYVVRLVTAPAVPWSDEEGGEDSPPESPPRSASGRLRYLWRAILRKLLHFVLSPLNVCE